MNAWNRLGKRTQLRIALDVARVRGEILRKKFANVVGIGAGFRTTGQEPSIEAEVCLRFLVRKKWRRHRQTTTSVPRYIAAYPAIRNKRTRVQIPTDVSEFRGGGPHATLDLTSGIETFSNGSPVEYGAACCLVCDANAQRYVLTCYHVFVPDMQYPADAGSSCVVSATSTQIGDMKDAADPSALDAALAAVEDTNVTTAPVWSQSPVSRASDYDLTTLVDHPALYVFARATTPPGTTSHMRRTGPLDAQFVSILPMHSFPYPGVGTFTFSDVIEYKATVFPGDSGSAVMDGDGKLFGMHFYGQGNLGYALSAPRLFDPNRFSSEISLANV